MVQAAILEACCTWVLHMRPHRGRIGTNFGGEVLEQMFCQPQILVGGFV